MNELAIDQTRIPLRGGFTPIIAVNSQKKIPSPELEVGIRSGSLQLRIAHCRALACYTFRSLPEFRHFLADVEIMRICRVIVRVSPCTDFS